MYLFSSVKGGVLHTRAENHRLRSMLYMYVSVKSSWEGFISQCIHIRFKPICRLW